MAKQGIKRNVILRPPSFLGVARIVAQTELMVIVPKLLGETFAFYDCLPYPPRYRPTR
ncbi:MAG: hypothetical protein JWR21_4469 [Herminiimonas sp.]|nr:hypothetical protein [Herminiimonas sp.]